MALILFIIDFFQCVYQYLLKQSICIIVNTLNDQISSSFVYVAFLKTMANFIILPITIASILQITKLKLYETYLPWSSGITVLYWISVMFVKLISSTPWSVFSDTKFSNDLNSRLGGKLASIKYNIDFPKKSFRKPSAYWDHCPALSDLLKYNVH